MTRTTRAGSGALRFALVFAALVFLGAAAAKAQGGSPIGEMMAKGRNALNDLHYREADSIAKRILVLGTLLTPEQQVMAVQLRAASLYPEEAAEQHTDSAIVVIRQLLRLGTSSVPKDMSWAGLDSLVVLVSRASQPAKLILGSRVPGAILFMNDVPQGSIQSLRSVSVSPGTDVKLSIRAEKCIGWDTTVVLRASDSVRVGFRNPTCQP